MLQGKKYNPPGLLTFRHFSSIIVILRQPARTEHFLSAGHGSHVMGDGSE